MTGALLSKKESGARRGGGWLVQDLGAAGVGVRLGRRRSGGPWGRCISRQYGEVGLLAPRTLTHPGVGDDLDLPDHAAVDGDRGDPADDPFISDDEGLAVTRPVRAVPDAPDRPVWGELLDLLAEHEPAVGASPLVHVRAQVGCAPLDRDALLPSGPPPLLAPRHEPQHQGGEGDRDRQRHDFELRIVSVQVVLLHGGF